MRPPSSPSLDNYLKQMMPQAAASMQGPMQPYATMGNAVGMVQQEQNKLRQLMQKRSELEHQMRMLDIQISKVQGGLDVLQQLLPKQ